MELRLRVGIRVATLTDVRARILPQVSSRLTDSAVTTHYYCVQVHDQILTTSVTKSVTKTMTKFMTQFKTKSVTKSMTKSMTKS